MTTSTRKTAHRQMRVAFAAVAFAASLAAPSVTKTASAQEIQLTGPLAGAPAVRKLKLYREGRFEIAPTVSFTLLDEYRRTIFVGARLHYNITDYFSVGVWGAYGVANPTTDLTSQIDANAPRNSRTATNVANTGAAPSASEAAQYPNNTLGRASFADQTGKLTWVLAPEVQFIPFRGKLALFNSIFVDTDAFLHAGVGFVGVKEREDCGGGGSQPSCSDPASFGLASRVAIAPTFGLGFDFKLTDFVSLGVDYRALPFSWNRGGFDTRGTGTDGKFPDNKIDSNDQTFKFNQMITIAIGISLPTKPKISD